MYKKFKRFPLGFELFAVGENRETDDDVDLDLEELWETIKAGVYPERTLEPATKMYYFDLRHNSKPIISFDWLDYRGGVIKSRSTASDHGVFRGQINKATSNGCLFIGISAEHLITPIENDAELLEQVKESAHIDRMAQLVKDTSSSTPAVFVITKSDLVGYKRRSPDGVVNDLKKLFPVWFTPGNDRLAMVCPVSVVSGENLENPLVFAAWAAVKRELRAAAQEENAVSAKYAEKYDGSFIDDVHYGLSDKIGSGNYKREVDALGERQRTVRIQRESIQMQLSAFVEAIVPMILFKDGKELSDQEKRDVYSFR